MGRPKGSMNRTAPVGKCEACGKTIRIGDDYTMDDDCVRICKECGIGLKADPANAMEEALKRFGDVGITDDLADTSVYHYRTPCVPGELQGPHPRGPVRLEPADLLENIELIERKG